MIKLFHPTARREHYDFAADKCMKTGFVATGGEAQREYEWKCADQMAVPKEWVLATNSCTAALTIAYHFLVEDTLLAPAMTWPGTYCGHRGHLQYYDDLPEGMPLGRATLVEVDLYGMGTCRRVGGSLIIDAAHNYLTRQYNEDLKQGAVRAVAFSTGPIKQLSTGTGGLLVSPSMNWQWRAFAHCAAVRTDVYAEQGGNYGLPAFNAWLGVAQLDEWHKYQEHRFALLEEYEKLLSDRVQLVTTPENSSSHVCVVRFGSRDVRDLIRSSLNVSGIQTGHHYALPRWLPDDAFPRSAAFSSQVLTLPLHLEMRKDDVKTVCTQILKTLSEHRIGE